MDAWIITGLIFVGAALVMYLCVSARDAWLGEVHLPYKLEPKPDLEGAKRAVDGWVVDTPKKKRAYIKHNKTYWGQRGSKK